MPRIKKILETEPNRLKRIQKSKEQDDLIESVLYSDNQEIIRPKKRNFPILWPKIIGFFVLFVLVLAFYFLVVNRNVTTNIPKEAWYAVKLVDGETFYGKISDIRSDPMVINNVYYNYDQLKSKDENKPISEVMGNIRLVKRGKEVHSPDGTLNVIRSQVLFLESMKQDSKILQAIQNYENR